MQRASFFPYRTSALSSLAALTALAVPSATLANPDGGIVAAGSANIVATGHQLNIYQSTDRAVIDWRSFDIGAGEHTQFHQPSASSLTVNRVGASAGVSTIQGMLSANGRVVVINPNGMVFAPGSVVDVAGLVATTADISNANAMAGHMAFDAPGNIHASIINQGSITVREAGLAAFVAPWVENQGHIQAKIGTIHLASGDSFTLDMMGDGLISLAVSDAVQSQLSRNTGQLIAQGGSVYMTAAAAQDVVNAVVNNSGIIEATQIDNHLGEILLHAEEGITTNSGTLDVSGHDIGQQGGKVQVLGEKVALLSGSTIDASGYNGGGIVRVGGEYQGKGNTPTATTTYADANAKINVRATHTGNGGEAIVWADENTGFYGHIDARGGQRSGNGGFVETSGKVWLDFNGTVDSSATDGRMGTLLLDPGNITISNGVNAATWNAGLMQFQGAGAATILNVTTLETQLASSNVLVTTSAGAGGVGNLTVSNDVTWSSGTALTLFADNDITINAKLAYTGANPASLTVQANNAISFGAAGQITATGLGAMDITLNADRDQLVTPGGYIYLANGASLSSNGGNITLGGGLDPLTGSAMGNATRRIGINLNNAALAAKGGNISLRGQGYQTASVYPSGVYANGGALSTTASGAITIHGKGGNVSAADAASGVFLLATPITLQHGDLTITGTGGKTGFANSTVPGVYYNAGTIHSTGSGNITITGYGGTGGYDSSGINLGASNIFATYGNITLTGTGNISDASGQPLNYGVNIYNTAITASHAGRITLDGTAGINGSIYNMGVVLNTATVTSHDGDITVKGVGRGSGSDNHGIFLSAGGDIYASGNANITLQGHTLAAPGSSFGIFGTAADHVGNASTRGLISLIADTVSLTNMAVTTRGDILFRPLHEDTTVGIGLGAGTLQLTHAILAHLTYGGRLSLGGTSGWQASGDVTLDTAHGFTMPLDIVSGRDILLNRGLTSSASGNSLVLAAKRHFLNTAGPAALQPGSGRYLVYSDAPESTILNGLSGFDTRYQKNFAQHGPNSIGGVKNSFLYRVTNQVDGWLQARPMQLDYTIGETDLQFSGISLAESLSQTASQPPLHLLVREQIYADVEGTHRTESDQTFFLIRCVAGMGICFQK